MRAALIHFSGTGNTEFVAKMFKSKFGEHGVECSLVDISKKKILNTEYDFYVFGCPVYAGAFPDYFNNWVEDKVKNVQGKKCIVFSTKAGQTVPELDGLTGILEEKGFEIIIKDSVQMPNNYYIVSSNKFSDEKVRELKEKAKEKVSFIVDKFLKAEKFHGSAPSIARYYGKLPYKTFYKFTREWAKNGLTVDYNLCVKCGKCAKNCPTGNISMKDEITFSDRCISCQKCIHKCPVNAFLYKGKAVEQYKI